jgi:hypothetical protein
MGKSRKSSKRLILIQAEVPNHLEILASGRDVERGILRAIAVLGSTNFESSILYTDCDDRRAYYRVIEDLLEKGRIEKDPKKNEYYRLKI